MLLKLDPGGAVSIFGRLDDFQTERNPDQRVVKDLEGATVLGLTLSKFKTRGGEQQGGQAGATPTAPVVPVSWSYSYGRRGTDGIIVSQ